MNQEDTLKVRENKKDESISLDIYFVRHGETKYLEEFGPGSHEETGKWDPELVDLTEEGKAKAAETARIIGEMIDPHKQIAVILTTPRARGVTTAKIISEGL